MQYNKIKKAINTDISIYLNNLKLANFTITFKQFETRQLYNNFQTIRNPAAGVVPDTRF